MSFSWEFLLYALAALLSLIERIIYNLIEAIWIPLKASLRLQDGHRLLAEVIERTPCTSMATYSDSQAAICLIPSAILNTKLVRKWLVFLLSSWTWFMSFSWEFLLYALAALLSLIERIIYNLIEAIWIPLTCNIQHIMSSVMVLASSSLMEFLEISRRLQTYISVTFEGSEIARILAAWFNQGFSEKIPTPNKYSADFKLLGKHKWLRSLWERTS